MAIAKKPSRSPAPTAIDPEEKKIQELISRGGSQPTTTPPPEAAVKSPTPILLRIPAEMVGQLDAALKARPVRLPRHTWILEAIHEKLLRDLSPPTPKS
jgi:hypothetical protein